MMTAEAVISQRISPLPFMALPKWSDKKHLITGEEFFSMDQVEQAELVKGEIVYIPAPTYLHGHVEFTFARIIGTFVHQHKLPLPPTEVERLMAHDELSGDDVLPGFRVRVAEFFE